MKRFLIGLGLLAVLGGAEGDKAGEGIANNFIDHTGPWARRVETNEKDKKEIEDFLSASDALRWASDLEGFMNKVDFPVYVMTDDQGGEILAKQYSKSAFEKAMRPFWVYTPKEWRFKRRPQITMLSLNMASVLDEPTVTAAGKNLSGKVALLLVKKQGTWKWKSMFEPGWLETVNPWD